MSADEANKTLKQAFRKPATTSGVPQTRSK